MLRDRFRAWGLFKNKRRAESSDVASVLYQGDNCE